ncbi:MAG TPA: serine/threonine-protein kinase [Solirubrobacteraceae bacterium]|jgi:serine/threonine-protein kinase|nr:serine/threonine-protein kinase [Solirubrobacteraceae bacterium]
MSDGGQDGEADPLVGQSVGGYRIEAVLGVGGMGRVYRAVGADGQAVALKLVRSDIAEDSVFRLRFEREARIAQQVKNPHVVPVLDTGEHEGVPYLSQRFVEGGSLEQKLKREGRLDVPTTLAICAQVADGLDALYAGGMVHRDVKPANVLLDLDGTALITDFGLAKDNQGTNLTRPGQALGSMDYMSPEQIRGEEVTAATDVYALGCVLCECLTGSPPFADRQGMRVLWAQLQDEPPDPTTGIDGIAPALGPAILRAMEKDRDKRPQSAGEYARLLYEAAGLSMPASSTGN